MPHVTDESVIRTFVKRVSSKWSVETRRSLNSNSTTFDLRTFPPDSKFVKCFKCLFVECKFAEKFLSFHRFHNMYKANSFSNNNKQVSDTAGTQLPTNTVSGLSQCTFISGCSVESKPERTGMPFWSPKKPEKRSGTPKCQNFHQNAWFKSVPGPNALNITLHRTHIHFL